MEILRRMISRNFFKFGFVVLFCFLVLNVILSFTITFLNNPLMLSYHPDFFIGVLFGIAIIGCAYLGWNKKE